MQVEDPFLYSDRWDSVGLNCRCCMHAKNVDWPDRHQDYGCELYAISLAGILNKGGHVDGEWFCASFKNYGKANQKAVKELSSILANLRNDVLYGAFGNPYAEKPEIKGDSVRRATLTQRENRSL